MISDSLIRIGRYKHINSDIYLGLEHLAKLQPNAPLGTYSLSPRVIVHIDEYTTKPENAYRFEAHKHVIDIQYALVGREKVQWSPLENMIAVTDYDPVGDRTWYQNPSHIGECILGDGVFAIYYPEDAHNPQLSTTNTGQLIKKVTIKVMV